MNFIRGVKMVNAIDKSFLILEKIASSELPLTPAQIADELQLNRATCSRILKQLLDMGYAVKVSRQQGYAPGPKLHTMGMICRYSSELLKCAIPVIDRCAAELQSSVLLSKLSGGRRYILYHRNCNPDLHVNISRPCYNDIFGTATGLLLAAYCSKSERMECFKIQQQCGGTFIKEFSNAETLNDMLDKIRQQGYVEMDRGYQWLYAYPVKSGNHIDTAVGMSMLNSQHTPELHRKICRVLAGAAQEISHYSEMKFIIG